MVIENKNHTKNDEKFKNNQQIQIYTTEVAVLYFLHMQLYLLPMFDFSMSL